MNNNNQTKKNSLREFATFAKSNIRVFIILFLLIFLSFIIYQGYSYYNINKVNNLSISYFKNKDLDDQLIKLSEMNKIQNENGFYAILSKLELIEIYIDKEEYEESLEMYKEILNSKELDNNYISLVAIKAAYNFIDIVIKKENNQYITDINNFIFLIDEKLDNYIGNKNELLYLVSILSLDDDSTYRNNSELLNLYEMIMNNQKISSSIKERVKKIHEFYIFI